MSEEKKEQTRGEQLRKALLYEKKNGYDRLVPGELEAMEAVLDRLDAAGDPAAVGEGLRELRSHLETVRSLSGTEIIS